MKPNKVVPRYPTLALEKGLDILELFASEPAGLTKSDFRNLNPFATGANPNVYVYPLNNRLFTVPGLK
jgi:hypothetical protein